MLLTSIGDQLSSCHVQPFVSRCRYVLVKALQGGSSHGWLVRNGRTQTHRLWWLPHSPLAPWLFQCYVSSKSRSLKTCGRAQRDTHTLVFPLFPDLQCPLCLPLPSDWDLNCTKKEMTEGLIHYFTRAKTSKLLLTPSCISLFKRNTMHSNICCHALSACSCAMIRFAGLIRILPIMLFYVWYTFIEASKLVCLHSLWQHTRIKNQDKVCRALANFCTQKWQFPNIL